MKYHAKDSMIEASQWFEILGSVCGVEYYTIEKPGYTIKFWSLPVIMPGGQKFHNFYSTQIHDGDFIVTNKYGENRIVSKKDFLEKYEV